MQCENALIPAQRLRDDFSRAAGSYDAAAYLQQEILEQSVPEWIASLPQHARLLDAGCATGGLVQSLKRQGRAQNLIQIDIAEGMCRKAQRSGAPACCADIRALPFAGATFEAIVCSSTLQWVTPVELALQEFARILVPGGRCLLNVFVRGSLSRLAEAFSASGMAPRLLDFPAAESLLQAAAGAGLVIQSHGLREVEMPFTDFSLLLQHFRALGAEYKAPHRTGLTRQQLHLLEENYPRDAENFMLDFTLHTLHLSKP